jgi:hypothetical protein
VNVNRFEPPLQQAWAIREWLFPFFHWKQFIDEGVS